ncbi:MAG: PSD1 and planctomycete cytochrome C domain-containing protein [Gemmataceae bacterium]|nr:PSD1 and planctomycete cytochrome C domain-containing protein [Gemmataceae bacterium]MCI0740767.1 PSD1 and planctomycete cytochrome C domain-containing protein [Gemmataceae bacterium]
MVRCAIAAFGSLFLAAGFVLPSRAQNKPDAKIQYARDIQPILSTNCLVCHGPDEKLRKGGLRLDLRESATKRLRSGMTAIVPGKPDESEMVVRIFSKDSDRMPPAKSNHQLKDAQKEILKRWVAQGAEYQAHWAFVAPVRPSVPSLRNKNWARNPIDSFVLKRLEAEGLQPAPEADRFTLARRVALDLTGLPPALDMVDRFVKDASPDAYEKYVDQVLALPSYGERWAQVWLDLARYADSNGYAEDQPRTIWKFRDWVIQAINDNMPYDRFTVEQLAADLLPNPTPEQLIATAFHRNTLTNTEGGTNDEEFRNIAIVDRVNTTFQVWMGLTMACANCHSHKYDPLSQEEYFQVFAILNQTQDSDQGDNSPNHPYLTAEQATKRAALEKEQAELQKELAKLRPELDEEQTAWEKEVAKDKLPKNIQAIINLEAKKRNAQQKEELANHFRSTLADIEPVHKQMMKVKGALAQLQPIPTPIMKELPEGKKRTTKIHIRGDWLNLGKEVRPGVPALFHPLPEGVPADRLALANWLVDRRNPLTARVAVNRYWEQIFGVGLVETPEDFGLRSKLPTHPELLDWLAVEFQENMKWDVKKLLKLLVTSAAYRQTSKVTPAQYERDPDNRLFARGPRFRISAETVRDQALAVSGLLSKKMFGPSVKPPQPKFGLTAAFGPGTDWTDSSGDDKYRRGLYTYWRRTTPYPSMVTFDAPTRTVCAVNRPRTNTPLQALVTLNDPCYVEAAQALARRILKEGGASVESRVEYGFRLCLIRPPQPQEIAKLVELHQKAREDYAGRAKEASQIATEPLGPLPAGIDAVDAAAWTVVSNVLLNLDEMFAKR